jgi:hypothetical protein
MVETAKDRTDSDAAVLTLRPWSRRLEAEGAMRAIVVVVADELGQNRAQVALVNGYQLVEALAADRPHPTLRDRVARRSNRRPQTLDAEP